MGWQFFAHEGYDKVTVDTNGGTFELLLSPETVTNLRTNVDSRNLWDKADLCRAMGAKCLTAPCPAELRLTAL